MYASYHGARAQRAPFLCLLRARNAEGQTLIAVTHDPRVAEQTDRTVILRDGVVVNKVERKSNGKG